MSPKGPGARGPGPDLRAPALSVWERATGLALGEEPIAGDVTLATRAERRAAPAADARRGVRCALDAVLARALSYSPCVVSFSGGRDSSVVLAAATAVARREGLALPIPVTLRFTAVAPAGESHWQEMVISHLGLTDWQKVEIGDELDLIGPVARDALNTHGLLWPPNAHVHVPILDRARAGCVLTGWDGDGLFGAWRWARAQAILHHQRSPRPRDALRVALALAPARARARWMRPPVLDAVGWVRDSARADLAALVRGDAAREPRQWDRRIGYYQRRRYLHLGQSSLELLGQARSVTVCHPFLDPGFLAALARAGGAAGVGDRTHAIRALFADLLPAPLIARRSKAEFTGVLWSGESRAFAATWTGQGINPDLVDAGRLTSEWAATKPRFGANTMLQQAWLAAQARNPAGPQVPSVVNRHPTRRR